MKSLTRTLMIAMAMVAFVSLSYAQKVAYINSADLIAELPEVKQANTNLETLQSQLTKRLENKVKELQNKYAAVQKTYSEGGMSPKEAETKQAELAAEQQELAKMEQDMAQQVVKKREELLQPIYDRINGIIAEVAQSNGYDYVIDLVQGALLYYDPQYNLTDQVKARLARP